MKKMMLILFVFLFSFNARADYVNSSNGLHLRKEPSTESESLEILKYGAEVDVVSNKNKEWVKVKVDDTEGYVFKEFIQKTDPLEDMTYLGNYRITAYAWTGNRCANGNYPTTGNTVACNSLPFGTKVYIQDVGVRVVEDRGPASLGSEWIDLYLGDTATCIQWGNQYKEVYIVEE